MKTSINPNHLSLLTTLQEPDIYTHTQQKVKETE